MDSNGHCAVVKYYLVPNKIKSSTSSKPCVPISITGGENTITYHITDLHAGNSMNTGPAKTSFIFIYIRTCVAVYFRKLAIMSQILKSTFTCA